MINEIKDCLNEKNYKKLKNCFKSVLPQKIVSNIVFLKHNKRLINYKNPITMDEKLLILKDGHYKRNSLITLCTDKFAVRKYISQKGYDDILVKLIATYTEVKDIEWDMLPDKFAMKCNHGSGYNVIVTEKKQANKKEIYKKIERWMKQDYAVVSSEHHYRDIPRRIIVEEFIENKMGSFPIDYKFFASRGKIIALLIITDRDKKKNRVYLDEQFNRLNFGDNIQDMEYLKLKPASFNRMLEIARKLSEDFPFVRVDLYDKDGKVLFGELTFTPHGCCHDYLSNEAQEWMGSKIQL